MTLEPDDFTLEKYELFENYQRNVHHEAPSQISQNGFKRFLCGSPLQRTSRTVNGNPQQLGSYHQCYRIDGRLVAMGVLDLLPHCVSGVYLLYHSDFEKWSFGKLSAMREAALAFEGGYQYYYMGYYIHSCAKMRYKGEYKPSYLLDPETYDWNPLDGELRQLLDAKSYVSLSRERRLNEGGSTHNDIDTNGSTVEVDTQQKDVIKYPHPNAAEGGEAVEGGMSLFDLKVPGLMTVEEIEQKVPLEHQQIKIRGISHSVEAEVSHVPFLKSNRNNHIQHLVSWDTGDVRDPRSLKGIIGELVACLGPDVAKQVTVDFS